jgi:hypothetical protein
VFELPANTVGVHVRRTDNDEAIRSSTLDGFVQKMSEFVKKETNICFFLATDDPLVEQELVKKFGDRIITFQKSALSRNSIQGIQDALVDIIMLSRTRELIGSHWSSFTEYASLFSGEKRLHVVGIGDWQGPANAILQRNELKTQSAASILI